MASFMRRNRQAREARRAETGKRCVVLSFCLTISIFFSHFPIQFFHAFVQGLACQKILGPTDVAVSLREYMECAEELRGPVMTPRRQMLSDNGLDVADFPVQKDLKTCLEQIPPPDGLLRGYLLNSCGKYFMLLGSSLWQTG